MEVHSGHFAKLWVLLVKVETLRLANVWASCDSQVHHTLLLNLPHCLVDFTESLRDLGDGLNGAVVRDNLILDSSRPKSNLEQVSHQMLVYDDKFTR